MFGFKEDRSSRKYIDLIFAASSKWANWDPPKQIKVGDYGTIDRKSGQFEKDGNIYEDNDTVELAKNHPPLVGLKETVIEIVSNTAKRREFGLGPTLSVPGLTEASVKGQWEFGSKWGALLVMFKPQSTYIPPKVLLKDLVNIPALKDKYLVTESLTCPAYSLYLSSAKNDTVGLALLGTTPIPVSPGLSAGGEIETSWWKENTVGFYRGASEKEYKFTPLYCLKRIRKPGLLRRDSPHPVAEGDDVWVDAEIPWEPLDDDGEEEEYEDAIFDD